MPKSIVIKKLLFFVITLLVVLSSFAQSDQKMAIDSAMRAVTLSDIFEYKGKARFSKENWEQLDGGIVHTIWQLTDNGDGYGIGLSTLSRSNVVLYAQVYEWDLNEKWDEEDFLSLWQYKTLEVSRTNGLDTLINFGHLSKLPNPYTFGYACGAAGSMPEMGQNMMQFVEDDDISKLKSWLFSVNPTLRAYAYLGLRLLESRGKTLEPTTLKKMEKVVGSTINVFSCAGCTRWGYKPIYELLEETKVKRFLERKR